jgi:sugar transferase EpsL
MLKRTFDVTVATLALVILSPLLALMAMWVRFTLGSPVLFSQLRPGLNGKLFRLYKFRTMTDERDESGQLLPNEDRHTRSGMLLRRLSVDELPSLINVVRGDMSLVGPRPLLREYLDLYTPEQNRRHLVRPGITGLAQVSGRNELDWEERFERDTWYVDNRSFLLDVSVLARTVVQVFRRRGITPAGQKVMPPFTGSTSDPAEPDDD